MTVLEGVNTDRAGGRKLVFWNVPSDALIEFVCLCGRVRFVRRGVGVGVGEKYNATGA